MTGNGIIFRKPWRMTWHKSKGVTLHAKQTQGGDKYSTTHFRPGTKRWWVVSTTPRPGKRHGTHYRWGVTQDRSKLRKIYLKILRKRGKSSLSSEYMANHLNVILYLQVMPQNHCTTDGKYQVNRPECQTSRLKNPKALIVKCFRRRVWETRRSGATGWELLPHFSDVWCSSSLQLTSSSNWQRESLFRCQRQPRWMYVK
jgi:hypothetical protein